MEVRSSPDSRPCKRVVFRKRAVLAQKSCPSVRLDMGHPFSGLFRLGIGDLLNDGGCLFTELCGESMFTSGGISRQKNFQ
jgi:hypothetical protein